MRLIDADTLIDELIQRYCKNCIKRMGTKNGKRKMIYEIGDVPCLACGVDGMKIELGEAPTIAEIADINNAPTIDAVPIKHGHWIYDSELDMFRCSICKEHVVRNDYPFCHWCGAKMDEVKDNETN